MNYPILVEHERHGGFDPFGRVNLEEGALGLGEKLASAALVGNFMSGLEV